MGQEADRRWGALAGAAALAAALTALARPLVLAAALWTAGPLPALQTALWWTSGQSEVLQTAASTETIPLAGPEAEPPAPAAAAAAGPDIQAYFVELQGEQDRPADAAPVTEKTYAQGSGSQYIPCGAGSIKNNTRVSAAEAAAAAAGGLPFDIQLDSDQPQVLVMHTHATETYRPAAGLWYAPGDGARTTDRTRNNAVVLAEKLGTTLRTVDISASVRSHFKDIGHDMEDHSVTFENAQARERTQVLMDIANRSGGLVIGTGDLSELALGWCTYNGDHMRMYAVNCSIPKTLVRYLVGYLARDNAEKDEALHDVLELSLIHI